MGRQLEDGDTDRCDNGDDEQQGPRGSDSGRGGGDHGCDVRSDSHGDEGEDGDPDRLSDGLVALKPLHDLSDLRDQLLEDGDQLLTDVRPEVEGLCLEHFHPTGERPRSGGGGALEPTFQDGRDVVGLGQRILDFQDLGRDLNAHPLCGGDVARHCLGEQVGSGVQVDVPVTGNVCGQAHVLEGLAGVPRDGHQSGEGRVRLVIREAVLGELGINPGNLSLVGVRGRAGVLEGVPQLRVDVLRLEAEVYCSDTSGENSTGYRKRGDLADRGHLLEVASARAREFGDLGLGLTDLCGELGSIGAQNSNDFGSAHYLNLS